MSSRPPPARERGHVIDVPVVRRVPIAMTVALEVIAELQARERDGVKRWVSEIDPSRANRTRHER